MFLLHPHKIVAALSLLLILACGLNPNIFRPESSSVKYLEDSVAVLTFPDVPLRHCTAWSLNAEEGYWVTAAHCVAGGPPAQVKGQLLRVVHLNTLEDVAVLQGKQGVPALRLAHLPAKPGDAVVLYGYGIWQPPVPHFVFGRVSQPTMGSSHQILQTPSGPGMSGSPIVLEDIGVVVSMVLGRVDPFGVSWGSSYDSLWRNLEQYLSHPEVLDNSSEPHPEEGTASSSDRIDWPTPPTF